jgi:hypothetical protein
MEPGLFKLAGDNRSHPAQFAHVYTGQSANITTPTQLNATKDLYVRIAPTAGISYVSVEDTAVLSSVGMYLDAPEVIIVRAGEYLGATTEINVTPLGEIPA